MPGAPSPRRWLFLGVLIDVLTEPGAPVTVAEAVVPEGASPHGITNTGPPMEQAEAEQLLGQLAGAPIPT